jgi:hypothetical protein
MRPVPRSPITDRSVPYDDNVLYDVPGHDCPQAARERALDAAEALLGLVAAGKLDQTDIRIIEERSRSPMPTVREIAIEVGLDASSVSRRTQRITALIGKALRANARK